MRRNLGVCLSCCAFLALGSTTAAGQSGDVPPTPTFAKDVAPIIYESCVSCHRPGSIAPMSLTSYSEVRPWARAIRDKVVSGEMPPWHADPRYGTFRNERKLTTAQIETIERWVDTGATRGDDAHTPVLPTFAEGWQGGEPDYVFVMPEYQVPAEGEIGMTNFWVPNTFKEDRFLEAVEMRPGNPSVVHHGRIDVLELPHGLSVNEHGVLIGPDSRPFTEERGGVLDIPDDSGNRFHLISFVPGRGYERYAPGTGKRLTAGKWLRFNIHYQAKGIADTDATRLGVWFSKVPVTHEVFTRSVGTSLPTEIQHTRYMVGGKEVILNVPIGTGEIRTTRIPNIPPHAENWKIVSVTPVTEPITIFSLWPHMHLRGKDMMWIVTFPDGRDEVILSVPNYDFNWQLQYELAEPLSVPAGSKLTAIGHYDNSIRNRYNPAPDKEVYWAEQSWDEMFSPYLEYTVDSLLADPLEGTE